MTSEISLREREAVEPVIVRSNLISIIDDQLAGPTRVIFLEGTDGAGKTTILRQFAAERPGRTFGLFVSSASRWAYDPRAMLLELCEEMERVLDVQVDETSDERRFAHLQRVATKIARANRSIFYFLLDGIEEIPEEDRSTRDELFGLMPIGVNEFRFIVSGSGDQYPLSASAKKIAKPMIVPGFTADEVERYFEGSGLNERELEEIRKVTKGLPGYLASIRRLIESGISRSTIVENLDRSLPGLFELEWDNMTHGETLDLLLGILSYENRPYTIERLAELATQTPSTIDGLLKEVRFLEFDKSGVKFVSESFRRFAADRLSALRPRITDLFIDFWQAHADADEALIHLPDYFEKADQLSELVTYLSPERFAALYKKSPSLALVRQKAAQGIAAARKLERDADVLRFTLQQSAVNELSESEITTAEVRALTALNSYEDAVALAESQPRIEERLRLLAAIARSRREHSLPDDSALLNRIKSLYQQADRSALNQSLAEIAVDLFHSFPDLAIELVSTAGKDDAADDSSMDWMLARLSVQAQLTDFKQKNQQVRDIRERIDDPAAKKLSTEAMMILGGLTATEALTEADRLESAGDQLYVLQNWMRGNARRPDALEVLDRGLQIAVRATEYSATAGLYRSLASCLPYAPDIQPLTYYVGAIDAQRANLERVGPREEFIQLQLLLARAEWRFDKDAARRRYIDVYNSVTSVEDVALRASAFARLLAALNRMDPELLLESEGLHTFAFEELQRSVEDVLADSAEQIEGLKGVIEALSRSTPQVVLDLIPRINTESRRDEAYTLFIRETAHAPLDAIDFARVELAADLIADQDERDRALFELLRVIARGGNEPSPNSIDHLLAVS